MWGADSILAPDAVAHAVVAQALARGDLQGGWLDTYNGGFPFGPHYQSLPILIIALVIKLGVGAIGATQGVGLFCSLALPLVVCAVAVELGASPGASATGGLFVAYVSPFYAFLGGFAPHLAQGLVSQAVATPLCVLGAANVLGARSWRAAPLLGALLAAAHAQILVATCLVLAPAAIVLSTDARRRLIHFMIGAALMGIALYLPGLLHFDVPFAVARVAAVRLVGGSPSWFFGTLASGEMLDFDRVPVLTLLTGAGALVLVTRVRVPACRAALAALATTLVLAGFGKTLSGLGSVGPWLVGFFTPIRMLVLLPLSSAACVVVAADQIARAKQREWLAALPVGALLFALPSHLRFLKARDSLEANGPSSCGPGTAAGFDLAPIRHAVSALERGRLVIDWNRFPTLCPLVRGVELRARVPLGANVGGPGSQLGVLNLAFSKLDVTEPGSADRAQSLGVTEVLTVGTSPPPPGFRSRQRWGDVVLLEREDRSPLVAASCVRHVWRGDNRTLRNALFADLVGKRMSIADPTSLVRLEPGTALETEELEAGDCDASHARVAELASSSGLHRARVESPSPVDVVFRVTDFPTWQVSVDGKIVPKQHISPGFFAVRVPPGTHEIEARVSPLPFYVAGILAALAAVFAAAFSDLLLTRLRVAFRR